MNRDIALIFARNISEQYSNMANILSFVKSYCDDDEYNAIRKNIALILSSIILDVLNPIYDKFPGLEEEIELYIQDYLKRNQGGL